MTEAPLPAALLNASLPQTPDEIYQESFAIIARETGLKKGILQDDIKMRLIHACGDVDILKDIRIKGDLQAGISALKGGCDIFTDVEMVKKGIIEKAFYHADTRVKCGLKNIKKIPKNALIPTRSAVGMALNSDKMGGQIVIIGNAPTALEQLIHGIKHENWQIPALIIAMPVGFVGAVESKDHLYNWQDAPDYITLLGRKGGSAIASAAINAINLWIKS